jgi:hypothetical protein
MYSFYSIILSIIKLFIIYFYILIIINLKLSNMKKITLVILFFTFSYLNAQSLVGTWKMSPQAGALGVGENQGDISWWSNSVNDLTTRACYFDDEYIFNADGSFTQTFGTQTWLEVWQGVTSDGCGAPVSPHNGTNSSTWTHNSTNNTITINGIGAFLGLAKVTNTTQLTTPNNAPASITYTITSLTTSLMTLDISYGSGWWRFILVKQGVTPTCTDGIQNGDETGIDCGGSCTACLAQINLPVNFEGATTNYTVTDFGGNASTKVADPTDSNNTVIKTIKTVSAATWSGTTVGTSAGFSSVIPFTTSNRKVYVRVYSSEVGTPIRLKVEEFNEPTHSCETQVNTTVIGWQTIEFDFNNQATGTAVFNQNYQFNKMSIFFNYGIEGATSGEKTYYFDNINYGSALSSESFEQSKLIVYPNPVASTLNIQSETIFGKVVIYNAIGQEVFNLDSNSNYEQINVSILNSGIYYVKVVNEFTSSLIKFIKK